MNFVHTHPLIEIERGRRAHFFYNPRLSIWQNFAAVHVASTLTKNLLYPLDVAQTLMQTNAPDAREGVLPTLTHLNAQSGVSALFRGALASNVLDLSSSLGVLSLRWLLKGITGNKASLAAVHALLPPQLVLALVYPLEVARVRMIANNTKYTDLFQTLQSIYDEEGPSGLYKGFFFSMLELGLFMGTAFAGFELATFVLKTPRHEMLTGNVVAVNVLGALFAALLHYPFDTARKIVQARKASSDGDNVFKALAEVGEKHGIVGLWKGFSAHLVRLPGILLETYLLGQVHELFLRSGTGLQMSRPSVYVVTHL
jgi:hypothetical protein